MAKGVAHYLKDGTLYNGNSHKMADGEIHTGARHTKNSKQLFHLNELPKRSKAKALRDEVTSKKGSRGNKK